MFVCKNVLLIAGKTSAGVLEKLNAIFFVKQNFFDFFFIFYLAFELEIFFVCEMVVVILRYLAVFCKN